MAVATSTFWTPYRTGTLKLGVAVDNDTNTLILIATALLLIVNLAPNVPEDSDDEDY